jgi:hypothetical protein
MPRSRTFILSLSAVVAGLIALAVAAVRLDTFAPTASSGSPAEVVGGSIHVLASTGLTWNKVNGNDLQYTLTLPDNYKIDQIITSGVRGIKSPTSVRGAWKVELSSRNYAQAVTICSDPDPSCPLTSTPTQQIYANLSSANLFWERASGTQLRFHDKACDYDSPPTEHTKCDFLSNVTVSDSTGNSTPQPLASGKCSRFPVILDGFCDIKIGAP